MIEKFIPYTTYIQSAAKAVNTNKTGKVSPLGRAEKNNLFQCSLVVVCVFSLLKSINSLINNSNYGILIDKDSSVQFISSREVKSLVEFCSRNLFQNVFNRVSNKSLRLH